MTTSRLWQDLRHGLRMLLRQPGFAAAAGFSLTLGIGANTAVFSVFNGLFLRPLPLPSAERLVYAYERAPAWNMKYLGATLTDVEGWRATARAYTDVAAFLADGAYLTAHGETARVRAAKVSDNLGATLGVKPVLGRDLRPEDRAAALLTYGAWQRMFGGAASVVGTTARVDNVDYRVVGVLPREAVYPEADVWIPLGPDAPRVGYSLEVVGRMRAGVTAAQAEADLRRAHLLLPESRGHHGEVTTPIVLPLRDRYLAGHRTVSAGLLCGVALLLLLACANVAGMMMARGAARAREMAVRAALGAGRGALIAQSLVESGLVAALAGATGLALGQLAMRAIAASMPDVLPRWVEFRMDWRILAYTAVSTGVATLIAGAAPAWRAARAEGALRESMARGRRGLEVLVAVEVAIAAMLLVMGGLAFEALQRVAARNPGFREDTFAFSFDAPGEKPERRYAIRERLLERLRATAGVEAAGATDFLPLGPGLEGRGDWMGWPLQPEGEAAARGSSAIRCASIGYFRAMGIPLLAGRDFEARDFDHDRDRVIVNEAFAVAAWGSAARAVGRRVKVQGPEWLTVAGVIGDVRHSGLEQPARPELFLPYLPQFTVPMTIVARGRLRPEDLVAAARSELRQIDPAIAIFDAHTMREMLARSLWTRRASSWLFGWLGGIALAMAAAGVYGVVSYATAQRTREIGIRMALGARPGQVVRETIGWGMLVTGAGLAVGLGAAWEAARLMSGFLAGVGPNEPGVFLAAGGALAGAALMATLEPARRAASVDALEALRAE